MDPAVQRQSGGGRADAAHRPFRAAESLQPATTTTELPTEMLLAVPSMLLGSAGRMRAPSAGAGRV